MNLDTALHYGAIVCTNMGAVVLMLFTLTYIGYDITYTVVQVVLVYLAVLAVIAYRGFFYPRCTIVWRDQVAMVTGGSNGLGAAIAMSLAMKGVDVAVLDIVAPKEPMRTTTHGG
jgi:hypothetical protein